MRKTALGIALALVFLAATCLTLPFPVNAAPRTIVVPDDYASINAAIENAREGDTIFVRNGTYHENVRVTKAMRIVGENNQEARIDGNADEGYWVPMAVKSDNAVVSNLNLCNSHAGLQLGTVKNCTVSGNRIVANGFGIEIGWSSTNNTITGNIIASNGQGIEIKGVTDNLIYGNELLSNSIGLYLDQQSQNNSVISNMIDKNKEAIRISFSWDNTFSNNTIINTVENAMTVGFANNNTFRHNNFINNTGDYYDGGESVDMPPYYVGYTSENVFAENYWSVYAGGDYDGDGKGDAQHVVYKQNVDLSPLMSPVAFAELAIAPLDELPADASSKSWIPEFWIIPSIAVAAIVGAAAGLLLIRKRRKEAQQS